MANLTHTKRLVAFEKLMKNVPSGDVLYYVAEMMFARGAGYHLKNPPDLEQYRKHMAVNESLNVMAKDLK